MVISKHEPSTSLIKEIILNQMNYPYKTVGFLLSLMLLLGTVVLTSCQTADSDESAQVANIEPVLLETVTAVPATEEPVVDPIAEPATIDNCLDCHTNKELLIQTADPEVEVISENEGEG